jgi:tetratricopeptide (TPR) repeat protein
MIDPKQRQFLKLLSHVYIQHEFPERASVLLEGLRSLGVNDPEVLKMLGYAYLGERRYREAADVADEFIRLVGCQGARAPILLIQAQALWALGKLREARRSMHTYMEMGDKP